MTRLRNLLSALMPGSSSTPAVRGSIPGAFRSRAPLYRTDRLRAAPGRSIRLKLILITLGLSSLIIGGFSLPVMRILDQVLLDSLYQRGSAISIAAATPAAYSLLTDDRLALDNLATRIAAEQDEIAYLAIVDSRQEIVAHNRLDRVGLSLPPLLRAEQRGDYSVGQVARDGVACYEFRRPVLFNGQPVGAVVLGLDNRPLLAATTAAHRLLILVAGGVVLLALLGALPFSSLLTRPIERLALEVSHLQRGERVEEIPVRSRDELGLLTLRFNRMAKTIQRQKNSLHGYAADLEQAYNDTVRILAAALDARDNYTYGHSTRVARLALGLADRLGLDHDARHELELACLLHDVGKIHVPDAILNKRDRLDDVEQRQIVRHPQLGSKILDLAPSLRRYIPTVRHHHERFDGNGYPDRLCGDAIPLHAQIVALADTYDAITSSRPYRKGRSRAEAVAEIRRCSGSQFNPALVEPFIEIVEAISEDDLNELKPGFLCAS